MDFPKEEFERRLERANRAMSRHNLSALLFNTQPEILYFTGFRTLFWQSPTRPWFLIIRKDKEPTAVIPEIGEQLMRNTWVKDIRTWASPHPLDDGVSLLIDVLKGSARIGMPMGRESMLRMPLNDFTVLTQSLKSTCEFIDATPLVQRLRVIKSSSEIQKIKTICTIASEAFQRAGELFHLEQSLEDVFRVFKIELLRRGADDVPYLAGNAGENGYPDIISPPSEACLKAGDVLMLDTGAVRHGYFCDFDRNFSFQYSSDAAKNAYATLFRATDAALDIARPGRTCADLYKTMHRVIDQEGDKVGRYGHGLGLQLTEHPSLAEFDDTVLESGMVITLEPSMTVDDGKFMVHEENITITDDGGPELLSRRCPPELPIF